MIRPPVALRSRSSAMTTSTLASAQRSTTSATAPDAKASSSPRAIAVPRCLEQLEQALVTERRHLDRLAQRGPSLALGERPQE